eukprot:CAMPEP_0204588192 /NCGR_PEP_ID=MMETSP0661-20131031/48487_1 /ASSEMBLY_ACC=CAM_ASM_000606 /TAXON_ID=109239 /ORGANISM="Alexandrium margalefi, Strain AMGDE01CS-322" /LENGTH=242 /DNA_ID=CAMNT_0051597993 /DNA_START=1 /DNA_END=729 /DNA_ORIENTATION=+
MQRSSSPSQTCTIPACRRQPPYPWSRSGRGGCKRLWQYSWVHALVHDDGVNQERMTSPSPSIRSSGAKPNQWQRTSLAPGLHQSHIHFLLHWYMSRICSISPLGKSVALPQVGAAPRWCQRSTGRIVHDAPVVIRRIAFMRAPTAVVCGAGVIAFIWQVLRPPTAFDVLPHDIKVWAVVFQRCPASGRFCSWYMPMRWPSSWITEPLRPMSLHVPKFTCADLQKGSPRDAEQVPGSDTVTMK